MSSYRRSKHPLVACSSLLSSSALLAALSTGCGGLDFEGPDESSPIVPPPTSTASTTAPDVDVTSEGSPPPTNVPPVTPPTPPSPPASGTSPATSSSVDTSPGGVPSTDEDSWGNATSDEGEDATSGLPGSETSDEPTTPTDPTASTEPTTPVDPPTGDEVPMTDHCAAVADWDPAWSQWEDEVLLILNEYRAEGANCDTEGQFGPADPLAMDPILRCSSRLHSLDMFERDYFDHTNPDGADPFDRMEDAGFSGSYMGENIAWGQTSPAEVMEAWIDSDGHCSNVMNPNYTLIGVGYYPGSDNWRDGQHFWTQNFGAPLGQGGFGGGGGGR